MDAARKDFLDRKHERTMKLRAEFLKQSTNPHRHALSEGGHVFDPALQRFQAMRVSTYEHFKPTARSFRSAFLLVWGSIGLFAYAVKTERDNREAKFRSGEVAYKDRQFKFI